MITYIGELSIGQAVPGATLAAAAGVAGINAALPDLLARIAALQAFAPQPISFAAQLSLAQSMVTSVQTSITLGIPAPSIALQLAAVLALVAQLLAALTGIQGQLSIVTGFQTLCAAAGIHAYAYAGTSGAMGADLTAALSMGTPGGSSSDVCNALVLVTTLGATWTAMAQVFKVTP